VRVTPRLVFEEPPPEDPLAAPLRHIQAAILEHPLAAQALFRSLVAEGRRFAHTEEGSQWAERLAGTPLVQRGRLAWEALSLNALDDDPDVVLPSAVVDAFVQAISSSTLELTLGAALAAEPR
jgi:hypothetical protein